MAEAQAILYGLSLAKDAGFYKLIVESYSAMAVGNIQRESYGFSLIFWSMNIFDSYIAILKLSVLFMWIEILWSNEREEARNGKIFFGYTHYYEWWAINQSVCDFSMTYFYFFGILWHGILVHFLYIRVSNLHFSVYCFSMFFVACLCNY